MTEIWRPSAARVAEANLTRFMEQVSARKGLKLRSYDDLYAWSVEQPADFWTELARYADVRADWGSGPVMANDPDVPMPGGRFFPEVRLNFAEQLIALSGRPVGAGVPKRARHTQSTLVQRAPRRGRTGGRGTAQRRRGDGDRVAGFLPNLPETVIAMSATASLGATWSSCSPDFGVHGVLDRFGQIHRSAVHRRRLLLRGQEARFARADRGECSSNSPASSAWSWSPTTMRCARLGALGARGDPRNRVGRNSVCAASRSSSPRCRSTIRSTSCIPPAPPACRSASCTVPAARCCSTRRSTCCTPT